MASRARIGFTGVAAVWIMVAGTASAEEVYADLIFTNGKIVTVDAKDRIVRSVAIVANRIVAVSDDVDAWRGPRTKVVDLRGRTMLPGFIDAHSHVEGMANVEANFINIQAPPLKDGKAIIAKLKEAQARLPPGAWLIGQGTYMQVMPSRAELDAAFPDNPVRLDWSAHDKMINHKAAMAMGMDKNWPEPPASSGGRYERNVEGEVVIVRDAPAPWPKNHEFTFPEMKEGVRKILQDFYLKKGVTTVSDMSPPRTYLAYQELRKEGRLPTRVRVNYVLVNPNATTSVIEGQVTADKLLSTGITTGMGDDWIRVGAIKLFLDGAWGTTVALYRPQWKGAGTTWVPNNYGSTMMDQTQLNGIVLKVRQAGWQMQIHANGDRAQDMTLTAYENANKLSPKADARDRIEHFAHYLTIDPQRTQERLARMQRDHVIPSPQVAFLWRLTEVGMKEPNVKFFPMKTLINLGMHPPGGVDTVGTQNFATYPMFSIQRAVHRDTKYGKIVQPEEAISVMDGIRMFTIWSAEANFMEKQLGSIETGKLADFVVLAQDPLTIKPDKLSDIPVDMTILDGKVVYQR